MTKPKPKPKPKPKKYDYMVSPKSPVAICFASTVSKCTVARLWAGDRTDFHDAELQNATQEINAILDKIARQDTDPSRHLAFITFQSRLMLVRAHHDQILTTEDDDRMVAKALKIKERR